MLPCPISDVSEPQVVGDLQVHLLGLLVLLEGARPLAALLVHDAQVEQHVGAVDEAPEATEQRQRSAQVGDRRVPLAQVLVDQAEVVADRRDARLVADAAVERERVLEALPRRRQVADAIVDVPQRVEALRLQPQVTGLLGQRLPARSVIAGLGEARQAEQRLGALQVELRAQRQGVDRLLARQQVTAVGECRLVVTLRQAAHHCLALEGGPAFRRQGPCGGHRKQPVDRLQRGHVTVRLDVQISQHLELRHRVAQPLGRGERESLLELLDVLPVVVRHAETPVQREHFVSRSPRVVGPPASSAGRSPSAHASRPADATSQRCPSCGCHPQPAC